MALQADGRATWAKVAVAAGVSESTTARRGVRLLREGIVTVSAIPDPLRTGLGQPVLVSLSTVSGQARVVAELLAQRADVRFVSVVTGTSDVIAEVIVPSLREVSSVVLDGIQAHPAVRSSRTETVLRTCKISYDWAQPRDAGATGSAAGATSAGPATPAAPAGFRAHAESVTELPLDEVDSRLVKALNRDGRRTFADLAAEVGISEDQAARRVNSLRDRQALTFATLVSPAALGFEVEAFVFLKVDLPCLEEAVGVLSGHPSVRYLALTAGRCQIVAEVVLHNTDALLAFQMQVLAQLPGLRDSRIEIEVGTYKRAYRMSGPPGSQQSVPEITAAAGSGRSRPIGSH